MRILNEISDKSLEKIVLYLTQAEAKELKDSLGQLLDKPSSNHAHISSEDFQKEVTICIYDIKKLNNFNDRSIKLIQNDE